MRLGRDYKGGTDPSRLNAPARSGNAATRFSDAARFLNEARASTIAQHPGMVKVFDSGQLTDGTLYLLMEFLEGETVAARLAAGGMSRQPLAEAVTVRLGRQIASALAVAHARGIAHRGRMPAAPCVGAARRRFSRLSRAAGNPLPDRAALLRSPESSTAGLLAWPPRSRRPIISPTAAAAVRRWLFVKPVGRQGKTS